MTTPPLRAGPPGEPRLHHLHLRLDRTAEGGLRRAPGSFFNYVESALRRLELPAGGSFAMVSTLSADLGHTAIFPALCTAGTLHLVAAERPPTPRRSWTTSSVTASTA